MTTALTKSMAAGKRIRPPNLSLGIDRRSLNNTILDFEPAVVDNQSPISDDELQLSSPESASSGSPTRFYLHPDPAADELSKDLAVLKQLRKSVQTNLRLRPIRSINSLPKVQISPHPPSADPWRDNAPNSANSASPTSAASIYYTPMLETPHSPFTGRSTPNAQLLYDLPTRPQEARPLDPISLVERLDNSTKSRPLIIDTRPQPAYISSHIKHSINIVIPSLILKRFRKPNGGFQTLDTLRQFITTEQGQEAWDQLIGPSGIWDGDVVVYDEEMLVKDKDSGQSPAWALLPIITPLLSFGSLYYLAGGISAALRYPTILSSSSPSPETDMPRKLSVPGGGLFQLDTQLSARSQTFPEIDRPKPPPLRSPLSPVSSAMPTTTSSIIIDSDPSPPPSQAGFRKPPPTRRPSVPNLNRIVTTSAERLNVNGPLPKLQLRTQPVRSATLAVPSLYSTSLQPPPSPSYPPRSPRSPSALTLAHSNRLPSGSAHWSSTTPSPTRSTFGESESSHLPPPSPKLPRPSPPHSPRTPMPTSPLTARPDLDPPTTEEAFPTFTVSTILPNFLYLGPELTLPEHVEELQELGVKRILNIAVECDDDHGLNLREVFERYIRIPMRDTVEEDNIARGVREVCEILGAFADSVLRDLIHHLIRNAPQMTPVFTAPQHTCTAKRANHALLQQ